VQNTPGGLEKWGEPGKPGPGRGKQGGEEEKGGRGRRVSPPQLDEQKDTYVPQGSCTGAAEGKPAIEASGKPPGEGGEGSPQVVNCCASGGGHGPRKKKRCEIRRWQHKEERKKPRAEIMKKRNSCTGKRTRWDRCVRQAKNGGSNTWRGER